MSEEVRTSESDDMLRRSIRTLLPGLHLANYVERWSPESPAVRALTFLSEHVGYDPVTPGDLLDPDVPTAHECRPEGRVVRYFIDRTEVTEAYARDAEERGVAQVSMGGSGVVPERLRKPGETPEQYLCPWLAMTSVRVRTPPGEDA